MLPCFNNNNVDDLNFARCREILEKLSLFISGVFCVPLCCHQAASSCFTFVFHVITCTNVHTPFLEGGAVWNVPWVLRSLLQCYGWSERGGLGLQNGLRPVCADGVMAFKAHVFCAGMLELCPPTCPIHVFLLDHIFWQSVLPACVLTSSLWGPFPLIVHLRFRPGDGLPPCVRKRLLQLGQHFVPIQTPFVLQGSQTWSRKPPFPGGQVSWLTFPQSIVDNPSRGLNISFVIQRWWILVLLVCFSLQGCNLFWKCS